MDESGSAVAENEKARDAHDDGYEDLNQRILGDGQKPAADAGNGEINLGLLRSLDGKLIGGGAEWEGGIRRL